MTIDEFNKLPVDEAVTELLNCCGSQVWAEQMAAARPFRSLDKLADHAKHTWAGLSKEDWREAFAAHPRIGEADSSRNRMVHTRKWASEEQSGASAASQTVMAMLSEGNKRYEARFGHIFIVFATGKSASQMLRMLKDRLKNDPSDEIEIAAAEQEKITHLRLQKMIEEA